MKLRTAVLIALALSACKTTRHPPLRGTAPLEEAITLAELEERKPIRLADGTEICSDLLLRKTSVERFKDKFGKEFRLGIIEMSDDGHVSDDVQKDIVLATLRETALGGRGKGIDVKKSPGAVVVTFVHGWHHRSKVCDNNLACFRSVLQALSEAGGASGRPVFGIYIGWRGDNLEKAKALSFYNRKATAHRIGYEGGRDVLLDLDDLYRELNDRIDNGMQHPVTMVTAGHSFGGALVYSAVEGALVRELRKLGEKAEGSVHAVGRRPCPGSDVRPVRPGIGDLVVLVNPAFEARRYREFVNDEQTAGRYADGQLPVLLTVASEGDQAVKLAFPIGRSLYFSVFPWRFRGMSDIIGAGHYDPQTTHDLVVADAANNVIHPDAEPRPTVPVADAATKKLCGLNIEGGHDFATCKCEYPVPPQLAERAKSTGLRLDRGSVEIKPNENVSLRPRRERDPRSPYLVIRAAPEIISQHSDIYTPRFITFLTAYISEFLQQVSRVEPGSRDELPYDCGSVNGGR